MLARGMSTFGNQRQELLTRINADQRGKKRIKH